MTNNTHNLVPGPSGSRQHAEDEPMPGPSGIGRRGGDEPMPGSSGVGRRSENEPMPGPSGMGRRVEDEPLSGPSGRLSGDFSASSTDWLPSDDDLQSSNSEEEMSVYHQHEDTIWNNNIIKKAKAILENMNPQKILQQIENMLHGSIENPSVASNTERSSLPGPPEIIPVNKEDVDTIFKNIFAIMENTRKITNCLRTLGHNPDDKNKENMNIIETPDQQEVTDNEGKIPIGSGTTLVDKELFKKVNWNSHTVATRKLLLAVFKREEIATRSLTGKPSPVFQDRRPKKCLDQRKIADIIFEITNRFHVSASDVRSVITSKCADECKMMRTRNQNAEQNRANVS